MTRRDFTLTISNGHVFVFDGALLYAHYNPDAMRNTTLAGLVNWLSGKQVEDTATELDLTGYAEALRKYATEFWKRDDIPMSDFIFKLRKEFSKETISIYNMMNPTDPSLVGLVGEFFRMEVT